MDKGRDISGQALPDVGAVKLVNIERFSDSLFFSLTLRQKFGNRAKVAAEKVAVEGMQSEQVKASTTTTKRLLNCQELEDLKEYMAGVKDRICGPFGPARPSRIKEGFYAIHKSLSEQVHADLKEARRRLFEPWTQKDGTQHPGYVPALVAAFPAAVEAMRAELGGEFNPLDYPTPEELPKAFDFEWLWISFGVPEGLPEALRAEENERSVKLMREASQQMLDDLYTQFEGLISHATEKLSVAPGEKPKIFRDTLVGNLQAYCDVFEQRNALFQDAKLDALVAQTRQVLVGVSPERLRTYASVRASVREQFEAIKAKLDQEIVVQKSRRFELD